MFKNHPKGLIAAALSNMGERFGYYIMNAVLLLFIASKFGISDTAAGWIYAVFYFLIYVLSLPGGIIADRTKNYKGTIMTGLSVMAVGYLLLSIPILSTKANIGWLGKENNPCPLRLYFKIYYYLRFFITDITPDLECCLTIINPCLF